MQPLCAFIKTFTLYFWENRAYFYKVNNKRKEMAMTKDRMEQRSETEKQCDCGSECKCGCNEGKDCKCGHHCNGLYGECGCGCGCGCGRKIGKLIALLIVFFAGMGFNELWHGSYRCSNRAPYAVRTQVPATADGAGTVIIINAADGSANMHDYSGKKHKCHKDKHNDAKGHKHLKHHKHHQEFQDSNRSQLKSDAPKNGPHMHRGAQLKQIEQKTETNIVQ